MYLNIFLNRCDRVAWADDAIAARMYRDRERGEAFGLRAMNMYHLLRCHAGYGADNILYGVPIILDELDGTSDINLQRAASMSVYSRFMLTATLRWHCCR